MQVAVHWCDVGGEEEWRQRRDVEGKMMFLRVIAATLPDDVISEIAKRLCWRSIFSACYWPLDTDAYLASEHKVRNDLFLRAPLRLRVDLLNVRMTHSITMYKALQYCILSLLHTANDEWLVFSVDHFYVSELFSRLTDHIAACRRAIQITSSLVVHLSHADNLLAGWSFDGVRLRMIHPLLIDPTITALKSIFVENRISLCFPILTNTSSADFVECFIDRSTFLLRSSSDHLPLLWRYPLHAMGLCVAASLSEEK
jgi:hypothetical protein